jgi:ABC-2 type transport system ATP-binding protein
MNVIEASGLGKRYGSTWALRDCTLAIPAGHVAALVGPNGAGKSTLLNLAVGLAAPVAGVVTVLGGLPPGSPAALDGVAFVAQDTPLYKNLSAADLLHLTRNLNRTSTSVTPGPGWTSWASRRSARPASCPAASRRSSR